MPTMPMRELKPPYLHFIDLIRKCRIAELGKRGLIYVPKDVVECIAAEHKIVRYIGQLYQDGILGTVEGAQDALFPFVISEDGMDYVLNCHKTAEEILEYKKSLAGTHSGSREPVFTANDWAGVKIHFISTEEVLVTTPDDGVQHSNFEALGFRDHKTNKPNTAWALLLILAKHGGQLSSRSGGQSEKLRKQKAALTKTLKESFGLSTDPFLPAREEGGYKILIELVPPVVDERWAS